MRTEATVAALSVFLYEHWAPSLASEGARQRDVNSPGGQLLTRAALVTFRSFITSSNAAVSSACFWLCRAIFSLNLRGLFEDAIFPPVFSMECYVTHYAEASWCRNHVRSAARHTGASKNAEGRGWSSPSPQNISPFMF